MKENKSDKNGLHITHIRGRIEIYWYNKLMNRILKNINKIIITIQVLK